MKYLFLSLLLGTSQAALADLQPEEISKALAKYWRPRVSTSAKERTYFNYTERKWDLGYREYAVTDTKDERLAAHLHNVTNAFGKKPGGIYGGGLYMSVDPYASRSFGHDDFVLFMIKIPAGTLTLFIPDKDEISDEVLSSIQNLQCAPAGEARADTLSLLMRSEKESCRKIAMAAFAELKIEAISYRFQASIPKGCEGKNGEALVLVKDRNFSAENFKALIGHEIPKDPYRNDKIAIENLRRTEGQDVYTAGAFGTYWPEMPSQDRTKSLAWAKKNLINCETLEVENEAKEIINPAITTSKKKKRENSVDASELHAPGVKPAE